VLRHQLTILRRQAHDQGSSPPTGRCSWRALLRQQAAGIVACDFLLSVDTVWLKRL
jgi:hypothetical protein